MEPENNSKIIKPFTLTFFLILWYVLTSVFASFAFLAGWATDPTLLWSVTAACFLIFEICAFYCFWQNRKSNAYPKIAIVLTVVHIVLIPLVFLPSSSLISIFYLPSFIFNYFIFQLYPVIGRIPLTILLFHTPLGIILIFAIIFLVNTTFGIIVLAGWKKTTSSLGPGRSTLKKLLIFGLIVIFIALITHFLFLRQINKSEIQIIEMQVKKSDNGTCYEKGNPGYNKDMGYTGYDSMAKCLESGGILPEKSDPYANLSSTSVADGANGWKIYTNNTYNFSFQAPEDYIIRDNDKYIDTYGGIPDFFVSGGKNLITGSSTKTVLTAEVPKNFYSSNTSLKSATFAVNINDKLNESDCKSYKYGVENIILTETRRINNVNFYAGSYNSGDGSSEGSLRFYHTYQNGICYELIESLVITDSGMANILANHIDSNNFFGELDKILNTKLDEILSTFKDNKFTFAPAPKALSLNVVSPNGGEQWVLGSLQNIKYISPSVGFQVRGTIVNTLGQEYPLFYASAGYKGENTITALEVPSINVGQYKIKICQQLLDGTITTNCNSSGNYFTVK